MGAPPPPPPPPPPTPGSAPVLHILPEFLSRCFPCDVYNSVVIVTEHI